MCDRKCASMMRDRHRSSSHAPSSQALQMPSAHCRAHGVTCSLVGPISSYAAAPAHRLEAHARSVWPMRIPKAPRPLPPFRPPPLLSRARPRRTPRISLLYRTHAGLWRSWLACQAPPAAAVRHRRRSVSCAATSLRGPASDKRRPCSQQGSSTCHRGRLPALNNFGGRVAPNNPLLTRGVCTRTCR